MCVCMCVCVCVRAHAHARMLYVCMYVYWFGWQDHFIIFIFLKIQTSKKFFLKEHLYQRQIAVFQSTATCLFSFCPLRKDMPASLRERNRWGRWHWSWELEMLTQAWGDLSAEGQREVTALSLLQALFWSLWSCRLCFALPGSWDSHFFWYSKRHRSLQKKRSGNWPIVKQIIFPKKTIWKGNPNRNSRSSVEKCIKREGGNAAPALLWGPVDSTQVNPGTACRIPVCRMTCSATASQLKTWKQAWKTAKSVCSCKMNTYCGVLTLLLEYSVGLLSLMAVVFQLISSLLLFSHPSLFLISQIIFCYITYIEPINTWHKFFPLIFPRFVVSLQFIHSIYVHNVTF